MKNIFTLLIFLILVGCAGNSDNKVIEGAEGIIPKYLPSNDWKTIEQDNWYIQYPSDYTVKYGEGKTSFTLIFPPDSGSTVSTGILSLSILISDDYEFNKSNLDTNAELSLKLWTSSFQNINKLVDAKAIVESTSYHIFICTGEVNKKVFEFELWFCTNHKKLYVLSFCDLKEGYEKYKEISENIMSTFEFKN